MFNQYDQLVDGRTKSLNSRPVLLLQRVMLCTQHPMNSTSYLEHGNQSGSELDDWLQAEKENASGQKQPWATDWGRER